MGTERDMTNKAPGRKYPERGAGGYSHVDGTVEFYGRVHALLEPGSVVVDLGAGRSNVDEDPVRYRRELRRLQNGAKHVVGLDVDPVVLTNPNVDSAYVIRVGEPLPLADASVDMVVSDWTFEHLDDPAGAAAEIRRILRPGGWVCARTPNKWGYIGMAARAVPNQYHNAVLRRVQPNRQTKDAFPTRYLLNTRADIARHFRPEHFRDCTYTMDGEPAYFAGNPAAWRAANALFRLTPARCRSVLFVFLQRTA